MFHNPSDASFGAGIRAMATAPFRNLSSGNQGQHALKIPPQLLGQSAIRNEITIKILSSGAILGIGL
jgi:hypothetical protein